MRWFPFLILLLLVAGMGWSVYAWYRNRFAISPSPPRTAGFLNTKPGVGYVGSHRCGECHAAEAATYAEHPMGRSVSPAIQRVAEQHEAASSFKASGLFYAVQHKGERIWHLEATGEKANPTQPVASLRAEIAYAIGSGQQGQSFLVNRDGRYYQSPISWYVRNQAWDLSPGFEKHNQHFGRVITQECLFCHCNEAHVEADTINHFEPKSAHLEPVGCERCHGPGELHVAAHENGNVGNGVDRTIVNPRHLTPQLREAVCEQCHLQGEARIVHEGTSLWDFRPGLPLDQFVSVFVPPATGMGSRKAVSHVEQMHQSRCFQADDGKMGCISCHDPHVLPPKRERVAWYRSRCLQCHTEKSCRLSQEERHQQSEADSCIECHMPRGNSSNIAHTSITDHRIVRRIERERKDDDSSFRLVRFHSGLWDDDAEVRRDLGLALAELAERTDAEAGRRQLARQAHLLLKQIVESRPSDVAAWEALGLALWRDQRPAEALETLEKALQSAPRRELALQNAALVALEVNAPQRSIAYWDRLLAVNPYSWQAHAYRGQAMALRKQWPEAIASCDAALKLNPFDWRTRMLLLDCLMRGGDQRLRIAEEFELLMVVQPPNPERIRQWFDERTNSSLPAKKQ
jgi:tetratricopeptide (TPR) repeat protein